MSVSNILNYAGILITAPAISITGGASNVEANWDTPATLWDGGPSQRYVFWGDTTGELNIFEFNFDSGTAADFTLVTNAAYSETALSITINMKLTDDTVKPILKLDDCCYNPGFDNKRLRAMGDRLVVEGATNYRILKVNS